ncbi:hypothetical protein HYG77_36995 (plasmid) [Rhodococcus sp. ZPP]|uniref:hypothetical protein n=1 Tax=unclassified Rhodococcus (in: high G+C Gram-positive bacteria) TaxID=192944 RepID=UPI00132041A4|nr:MULTISPECIES: hypothetical protein [unclassified Rhodococcus (in: high G+C Gram-positive bacteria)]QHE74047.1 hypothetical protein GFS60_07734 [Rhodococcus sp. WAY2]QTJ71072.1 hypothetical protein HYG77_36995 [Rhodococcus sp. ZPP]
MSASGATPVRAVVPSIEETANPARAEPDGVADADVPRVCTARRLHGAARCA